MEGEMCPQVAVNDSYNCGGRPFYQYQFFPGRGFEGKYGVKQVPLPGRLNLNSDKPCMSNNEQRLNHEAGSQYRSGDWEGFSFMRNPDAENCCSGGDPVKSRESEGIEKIAPSDLRLDSSDNQSDVSASDSHHFIDLCTVEQKRKQTLFSNGSPTDHTGSINGHDCVDGSLSLKLCPGSYSYMEDARNPKRYRSSSPGSQFPSCQVDDCHADLKHAKDYHRRHKVCETHSKTAQSLVHGLMQRFCQQCSRFHPLPEFDEGKRSCRRRLAGHNKRRRKPHTDLAALPLPDAVRGSELLSMVAILSQLQPSKTKERLDISSKEQDFILQCLKKTDSFLPLSTYLARDTAAAAHQAPPQPLLGLQRSGQESQAGLLTTLASPSPEALLSVLWNSMASQVSPTQGEVQHPHISQQPTRNDKDNAPLFAYGVSSGKELHKVSNGTVERLNIQFARPFPFSDLAAKPNGHSNPSEWPSRPILTRQYLGPAGSHSKEGDFGSIPASNCAGAPAEQILFPALCGNGVRNETISRINGVVRHSESAERLLFVDGSDNRTSRQELSQNTVSDPPRREPSDGQDSGSDQSPASTSSDWQELNRRIIFKLFDKKSLEGFPQRYRAEIGEWLAIAPTSLELYLRPGCILLTVFLTMPQLQWEQLAVNL